MTKYKVLAEKVVVFDVEVIKEGTFWQYHLSGESMGDIVTMGLGCFTEKDAVEGAKHAIEAMDEVDRVRYLWREDED